MNVNRRKMTAAAVLAVTLLVVGGVTGYGLHRAGTVGQPFVEDGRLKVMASFYPMYDFARKVGGDRIQIKDMVPAGTEPHDWEPAATDIRNLEDADVFVYNGADLEHWAEDVLDTLENQDLVVSEASDGVELLDGGHDHAHGDEGKDPHVWLDPMRAKQEMKNIRDALVKADPGNGDYYEANYEKYAGEFDELDQEFRDGLKGTKSRDIIVAHEAFGYLCNPKLTIVAQPTQGIAGEVAGIMLKRLEGAASEETEPITEKLGAEIIMGKSVCVLDEKEKL